MAKFVKLNWDVMIGGKRCLASDEVIVIDDADFKTLSPMKKLGVSYITEAERPIAASEPVPEEKKPKRKTKNKKA
tara:strand:- start:149 stop:373 length:225 start_codon:yes stop_codon:yes gene_type:complete